VGHCFSIIANGHIANAKILTTRDEILKELFHMRSVSSQSKLFLELLVLFLGTGDDESEVCEFPKAPESHFLLADDLRINGSLLSTYISLSFGSFLKAHFFLEA
jgi:hypothetical protein